jgi:hypothetical protein
LGSFSADESTACSAKKGRLHFEGGLTGSNVDFV